MSGVVFMEGLITGFTKNLKHNGLFKTPEVFKTLIGDLSIQYYPDVQNLDKKWS